MARTLVSDKELKRRARSKWIKDYPPFFGHDCIQVNGVWYHWREKFRAIGDFIKARTDAASTPGFSVKSLIPVMISSGPRQKPAASPYKTMHGIIE